MELIALVLAGFVLCVLSYYVPLGLWIQACAAGVPIHPFVFVAMRLRQVSPESIVRPLIMARRGGLEEVCLQNLEAHALAGGNVAAVVQALIEARNARISLDFRQAAAIDLAGRDLVEAVSMSVNPKVIQTPLIGAMAQDGIQVSVKCRVTVKANIEKLVGGAGAETVVARISEGVVTTIGSAASHKVVLENPNLITQTVLRKGLDAGTAFEILSIDIIDVDVERNIGARLQIDQAEADKLIAQARSEQRRAEAAAREEEMRAQVEEMRARLVQAEADVPRALAAALRDGGLQAAGDAAPAHDGACLCAALVAARQAS